MADKTLYLVFSNPVEGKDDEFNEWYDDVHIHEVLSVPGLVSAQRHRLSDAEIVRDEAFPPPTHAYLCVYEMEGDVDEIMARIGESYFAGEMSMDDSMDVTTSVMSFWTPIGPKLTS
jgi:hypothetical protein